MAVTVSPDKENITTRSTSKHSPVSWTIWCKIEAKSRVELSDRLIWLSSAWEERSFNSSNSRALRSANSSRARRNTWGRRNKRSLITQSDMPALMQSIAPSCPKISATKITGISCWDACTMCNRGNSLGAGIFSSQITASYFTFCNSA